MQKTNKQFRLRPSLLYIAGGLAWLAVAVIWFTSRSFAASITQSYGTNSTLQQGLIVRLVPGNPTKVEAVPNSTMQDSLGVIINPSATDINLTNSNPGQHVFISNSGDYPVIVSNQNGYVVPGDYITISEIDGVGMVADSTESTVVGQATGVFNSSSLVLGTETIKGPTGASETVQLGLVNVNIAIARNPLQKPAYSFVPGFLLSLSKDVAGKSVSTWKIYMAVGILFLVLVVTTTMFYSAVRSSIISVGRNPLSARIITRGFVEIAVMATFILVSGIFGVYLLLKL